MEHLEYIASERFIHDELVRRAEAGLPNIVQAWKLNGKIQPFMISWPAEHIMADDGRIITDVVLCDLPTNKSEWRKEIAGLIERTVPYALLLCEQRDEEIVMIFESQHGTKSWRWPIKKHGQARVLGDRTCQVDTESIGILWRAKTAES